MLSQTSVSQMWKTSVCVWSVAQVWQSAKDAKCRFAEFWPTFQQESVSIMKVKEQKATLRKQQSLFTAASKKASALTQASFKVAEHKKPFTDGSIIKGAPTALAESLFWGHKNKMEMMSTTAACPARCPNCGASCRWGQTAGVGPELHWNYWKCFKTFRNTEFVFFCFSVRMFWWKINLQVDIVDVYFLCSTVPFHNVIYYLSPSKIVKY